MQIVPGSMSFSGSSSRYVSYERSERLQQWGGSRASEQVPAGQPLDSIPPDRGLASILAQAAKAKRSKADAAASDPGLARVLGLVQQMVGQQGVLGFAAQTQQLLVDRSSASLAAGRQAGPVRGSASGLDYASFERSVEIETASLTAEGMITLDDGSQLAFRLDYTRTSVRVQENYTRVAMRGFGEDASPALDMSGMLAARGIGNRGFGASAPDGKDVVAPSEGFEGTIKQILQRFWEDLSFAATLSDVERTTAASEDRAANDSQRRDGPYREAAQPPPPVSPVDLMA